MAQVTPSDCTHTWHWELESDGWYKAHDALRADLTALDGALAAFRAQLAGGRPLAAPQAAAAGRFLGVFLKFMHHHHHNEEEVAMPYMATRVQLPDKIASDHKELVALLDRFEQRMQELLGGATLAQQQAALDQAQEVFAQLRPLLLEHFEEEEREAMPLMRKHFTPAEVQKHVVSKIMRSMDADGTGAYFRAMTPDQRRTFFAQERIPFFIRWLLNARIRRFERNVWGPFERECLTATA